MASRDLAKRVQALEARRAAGFQMTPGQDAALNALRRYQGHVTWEQFRTDHQALAVEDLRLAYDAVWALHDDPEFVLSHLTPDCPPWAVSQLATKEIHTHD